jgi:hypothetical protein
MILGKLHTPGAEKHFICWEKGFVCHNQQNRLATLERNITYHKLALTHRFENSLRYQTSSNDSDHFKPILCCS